MIDVADPNAVLAGARDDEVTMTLGLGLRGGGADRVPFTLAPLRPLGRDPRPGDAPSAGRLLWFRGVRPVSERAGDAGKPLRLEPDIDGRLTRGRGERDRKQY